MKCALGNEFQSYGEVELSLNFNFGRFTWTFLVCDVDSCILGADFLNNFDLLVDVKGGRLLRRKKAKGKKPANRSLAVENSCFVQSQGQVAQTCKIADVSVAPKDVDCAQDDRYRRILKQFPELTQQISVDRPVKHNVMHRIVTSGRPVSCRPRRLSPEALRVAREHFAKLEKQGIVRPSTSPWSSALHCVPKRDNTLRFVGDFRHLNVLTENDTYPLPYLRDFCNNLHGKRVFSSIDLLSAYYQVPVHPDSIPKTAIVTPFGSFEFCRLPFGLKCAGQTFQRYINRVVSGFEEFCFAYVDDLLIASVDEQEHERHLKLLFQRLTDYGILINEKKTHLGKTELNFLGHRITKDGLKPLKDRVEAIRNFPRPETVTQLRSFLGIFNFYRRFIPHASDTLRHLNVMLGNEPKNCKKHLEWKLEAVKAFDDIKEMFSDRVLLHYPLINGRFSLVCDASNFAVGASLNQYNKGVWEPIAFFSKALSSAQRNYSTFDRELLGIYLAIKHFKDILQGRNFNVVSDHMPLVKAFRSNSSNFTPRQHRYMDYIAQYASDVEFLSGFQNVVADGLSRIEVNAISLADDLLSLNDLALQQQDSEFRESLQELYGSLELTERQVPNSDLKLIGDVSTGNFRPIVPLALRKRAFMTLHGLSHPGVKATRRLIGSRFVWHGLNQDVNEWSKNCLECQRCKVKRHVRAPLGHYIEPTGRFQDVNLDIVGPLPLCDGYSYLLTCCCRFSRWFEAIPLPNVTATTVTNAFLLHWVARFGAPLRCTSDRGKQFTSETFNDFCTQFGIKLQQTTAYRPESNGYIEIQHKYLKSALKAHSQPLNWHSNLGLVLLGLRSVHKPDIDACAAELVYGQTLRLPGEFFEEIAPDVSIADYSKRLTAFMSHLNFAKRKPQRQVNVYVDPELANCTHVFVRVQAKKGTLYPAYDGPFKVLNKHPKFFTLAMNGRENTVTVDRLKVANLPTIEGITDATVLSRPPVDTSVTETIPILTSPTVYIDSRVDTGDLSNTSASAPPIEISEQDPHITRRGRIIRKPLRFRD
uniref:Gypsy retrotransposon integrase-like protein 1 n=1 Tax=Phallusia mammillata TaxID=59560 RepID=A0A6F9DM78_9ASCI|nr:uncharacterized protein zf(cchc)-26 [Phallusia mammillata]